MITHVAGRARYVNGVTKRLGAHTTSCPKGPFTYPLAQPNSVYITRPRAQIGTYSKAWLPQICCSNRRLFQHPGQGRNASVAHTQLHKSAAHAVSPNCNLPEENGTLFSSSGMLRMSGLSKGQYTDGNYEDI